MKLALPILLSAATTPSPSVLPHALQLGSNLPDSRFRVDLTFDSPFLAVNPTFMNILHFMNVVAQGEFNEQLQPRTYSAPMYRQIQITSFTWTEARFLLWGIYLAATDMIRFTRFHNVIIRLYWDNGLVGQINLMVKPVPSLPGTSRNGTQSVVDDGGQLSRAGIDNKTTQAFVERLNTSSAQNITGTDTGDNISNVNSVKMWNTAFSTSSISPTLVPPKSLRTPRLTIDFDRIAGATQISRSDVFLTFYTAMLHLANFPAENDMQPFNSKSPTVNMRVHMFETGIGCLNGQAITAMTYVPQYMMEHPEFGYKETNFNVKLSGVRACRGSILSTVLSTS